MFPLHDDNPTQDTSFIVYALILINVLIFGYQVSLSNFQLFQWLNTWAVVPQDLIANPPKLAFTLISSQFLHANLFHLVGNMWFLYLFGNNIEDKLGHWKFLLFYVFCGAIAAAVHVISVPTSAVKLVGASGAISGIMGAYLIRFPRARILSLVFLGIFFTAIPIPAAVFLGLWIAGQTVYAAIANPNLPGVAYLAHVSGFVAGAIVIFLATKLSRK
ncbi:MAG: rhomboid family intramembrane serine protease [Oscillatoriales cyanobacterium CG2_30_44_21]|nr:MAG: rhomboid family intramembrane serine protease [Oscillatoriales cyanobacterium CG2_30_44_21]